MMERERTTLEQRQLDVQLVTPAGFQYPDRYLRAVSREPLDDIEPWMWLSFYRDQLDGWREIVSDQFPERTLVPFAKHQDTDDVFCFDGTDHTGDPPVLIIHTFTTPGWEYRGEWASFDDWWAEMEAQHADWLAEEQDED